MTADQALKIAQGLLHSVAHECRTEGLYTAEQHYRLAAEKLDEVRAGISLDGDAAKR